MAYPWNENIRVGSKIKLIEDYSTWGGKVYSGPAIVLGMEEHWQGNIPIAKTPDGDLVCFGFNDDLRPTSAGYKIIKY